MHYAAFDFCGRFIWRDAFLANFANTKKMLKLTIDTFELYMKQLNWNFLL